MLTPAFAPSGGQRCFLVTPEGPKGGGSAYIPAIYAQRALAVKGRKLRAASLSSVQGRISVTPESQYMPKGLKADREAFQTVMCPFGHILPFRAALCPQGVTKKRNLLPSGLLSPLRGDSYVPEGGTNLWGN